METKTSFRITRFFGGFVALALIFLAANLFLFLAREVRLPEYASFLKAVIFQSAETLAFNGRTNILVLGKGGEGHTAGDLTDTIIFFSISQKGGGNVAISIPRDVWIYKIRAKINSAYYWGGGTLAKSLIGEIVGKPVHFVAVVDFSGFKKIIDVIGGVEVAVVNSFTDQKFPISGRENDDCGGNDPKFFCRYETLRFTSGKQIMDGEEALKFVRSRNAEGVEGTDIAREERQQRVILAIKAKATNPWVFLNPRTLLVIKEALLSSIETDLDAENAGNVIGRILFAKEAMQNYVLPEDLIITPPKNGLYDNQYVLIPKDGTWDKVHSFIDDKLD